MDMKKKNLIGGDLLAAFSSTGFFLTWLPRGGFSLLRYNFCAFNRLTCGVVIQSRHPLPPFLPLFSSEMVKSLDLLWRNLQSGGKPHGNSGSCELMQETLYKYFIFLDSKDENILCSESSNRHVQICLTHLQAVIPDNEMLLWLSDFY